MNSELHYRQPPLTGWGLPSPTSCVVYKSKQRTNMHGRRKRARLKPELSCITRGGCQAELNGTAELHYTNHPR